MMTAAYEILSLNGLAALKDLGDFSDDLTNVISRALNKTLDRSRADAAKRIRNQVNFSASYLNSKDRLAVKKYAKPQNLEGVISARNRPTSLARFAKSKTPNKTGVSLEVSPGSARFTRRAFIIRLRAGKVLDDETFNLGLAIRLKPGEKIDNKKQMIALKNGLYLLYGPSVGQAFGTNDDSRASVRKDVQPAALDFFEDEFDRLLSLRK